MRRDGRDKEKLINFILKACYTEVQHITGEGSNAGVVYCEMVYILLLFCLYSFNNGFAFQITTINLFLCV